MLIVDADTPDSVEFEAASKQDRHSSRDILSTTAGERITSADAMIDLEFGDNLRQSKRRPQYLFQRQAMHKTAIAVSRARIQQLKYQVAQIADALSRARNSVAMTSAISIHNEISPTQYADSL